MTDRKHEARCVPCKGTETRKWYGWNDFQPPRPDFLHVIGEALVENPGVDPMLVPAYPQGINPSVLLLDLYLCQRAGYWPQVTVWKQVRYSCLIETRHVGADVRCDGDLVERVKVLDLH